MWTRKYANDEELADQLDAEENLLAGLSPATGKRAAPRTGHNGAVPSLHRLKSVLLGAGLGYTNA